jgi:hypothetical protein
MHTHHLPRVILGVCVVMLALSAGAQTTTDNASQSTAASATSAPNKTPSIAGAGPTPNGTTHKHHKHHKHQKHQKHHAVSHNRSHSHGATMAMASAASNGETTYRAALRKCVEGQKARRDSCLNDAIAQFGHP